MPLYAGPKNTGSRPTISTGAGAIHQESKPWLESEDEGTGAWRSKPMRYYKIINGWNKIMPNIAKTETTKDLGKNQENFREY